MTPAEVFRDAARIVREYAGKAPAGPWWLHRSEEYGPVLCNADSPEDREAGGACIAFFAYPGDLLSRAYAGAADAASWMALMGPLIAEPLAAALDAAAADAEGIGRNYHLLVLAHLIRSQHQAMQGGEPS